MVLGMDIVVEDDIVGPVIDAMNVDNEFAVVEGMLAMEISMLLSVALFLVASDR